MKQKMIVPCIAALFVFCVQVVRAADSSPLSRVDTPAYVTSIAQLSLAPLLPPAPAQSSKHVEEELRELHQVELTRTPAEIKQAQADDKTQDIFLYANVLGENFTAAKLPHTALLAQHLHLVESSARKPLKQYFERPRPYQVDHSLHPVCATTDEPNSYPSGHTLSGYLMALALVEMVPEKHDAIMDRANAYAHDRVVCGVHYASDVEAGKLAAYSIYGYLSASAEFQKELLTAREETRAALGYPSQIHGQ